MTKQEKWRGRKIAKKLYPTPMGMPCEVCNRTDVRLTRNHLDGNPMNNDRSNIVLCCWPCHAKEDWARGRWPNPPVMRGADHPKAKLKAEDVPKLIAMFKSGVYVDDVAKAFGMKRRTVYDVVNGKRYWCHWPLKAIALR